MKLRHLILAGTMALPLLATAKPAYPGIIRVPDANGGYTEIRRHGDEFFNYATDSDCQVVLQRDARGQWVPMMRNGVQVTNTEANVQMLRAEEQEAVSRSANSPLRAPQRMASLDTEGRTNFPTLEGDIHSLVVLMEYSDIKFTIENPVEEFSKWLNEEGYNGHSANGSVADYYRASSRNLFRPIFDVKGVVSLPKRSGYYVGADGKYGYFKEALNYAVQELDSQGVDFSKYDYDNDGIIDTIYFIYAGYGQADTPLTNVIWPHQSTMEYEGVWLDGKKFGPYACSNELNGGSHYTTQDGAIDGIGGFCHEFGHVLGLPDLYDPSYASTSITPGAWSLMDQGSYNGDSYCPPTFSGYERWVCRWVDYTIPEDGTHYELDPINQDDAKVVKLPARRKSNGTPYGNEYFVAESRSQKDSHWDAKLPGEGMLIWHIDYQQSVWTSNRVNSTKGHPRVSIVSSDGSANPFNGDSGNPSKNAAWPGYVSVPSLYPGSTPALDTWASGTEGNANIFVTDIKFDAERGVSEFDFNKVTEVPNGVTTMQTPKRIEDQRAVRLYWDADPAAKSYQLTMYRINSSGSVFYESGLNELNVGNVTSYDITGLSTTKMGLTYYAYVRAVYELPSSEISNEVEFVPNDLEITSSVGSLVADGIVPVVGGKGCIVAPADAQIYTVSGMRAGRDNLAPGMYIVRTADRVVKVVVR